MEYNGYEQQEENKFRSKFIIIALAVLAVALIAAMTVLITMGVKQSRYNSKIENANYFFSVGDYQSAIIEYENAIQMDAKNESAYLNLAAVYQNLGDYDAAINTIDRGLMVSNSARLQSKKSELMQMVSTTAILEQEPLTEEEIKNYSSDVTLENNIFDMAALYTYTEYVRDYGNVSALSAGAGIVFNYINAGFEATYEDISGENIIDAASGRPYAHVKPNFISFKTLYKVFSSNTERFVISYAKLTELFGDKLSFHQEPQTGMYYITAEYKNCRISIETDEKGNIVSEHAWNKLEPLKRTAEEFEDENDGEVQGYIQDAMTGKGMKATIKVREKGKKSGAVIKELTAGRDGGYTFSGDAGKYTMEVSAKGYVTEYMDIEVIKNQTKTGINVVLAPEVAEGEIRIVLTWGSSPTDLDSYAIGKDSNGNRFSINYKNRTENGVGNLDVDDTSGYGPETITITDVGASFTYTVINFRGDGEMGGCGATVKVYLPGKSAMEFKIPAGSGLRWDVFEYENGEIKKINDLNNNVNQGAPK